jgi:hypothetical protein
LLAHFWFSERYRVFVVAAGVGFFHGRRNIGVTDSVFDSVRRLLLLDWLLLDWPMHN